MKWDDVLRRIAAGEAIGDVLDEKIAQDRANFIAYLRRIGRPELAEDYQNQMRALDLGLYGAQNTWHSLTAAQRRTLIEMNAHGGRMDRVGNEYRHRDRHQPYVPIYVATVRNLCARGLLAWDGGAFDPECAAVLTERGRFVLQHGAGATQKGKPDAE